MSLPPASISRSSSTVTTTPTPASKRHSSNIGPRPLHLVDGNVPFQPSGPLTAPLAPTYSAQSSPSTPGSSDLPPNTRKYNSRRQSSISYFPRDINRDSLTRSPGNASPLLRSNSVGLKSESPAASQKGDRRSTGSTEQREERTPLTLVEKHAELLQFIAQKESKCLELRSQLAVHESELLQLKRKWERIVSRGFDRANGVNDSSPPPQTCNNSQAGGAMLEGIKEGVQGVSRFLASGLTEFSSQTQSPTPQRRHSMQQSNSSVSTSTTKSTRLSQSSASSLEEEEDLPTPAEEDHTHVLMVHDTGATPTMSPNPEFTHRQQQKQQSSRPSIDTGTDQSTAAKIYRRKSRDHAQTSPPSAFTQFDNREPLVPDSTLGSASSPTDSSRVKQSASAGKRASMNSSALPPAASIPGLGSLSAVGGSVQPISSWVGTVGKRWEELQRGGTFMKSQKRASLLLSDFSESIASALSSPPLASAPYNPVTTAVIPAPSLSCVSNGTNPSSSSASLLDDDCASDGLAQLGGVMTPDSKSSSLSQKPLEPPQLDPDDEWNW